MFFSPLFLINIINSRVGTEGTSSIRTFAATPKVSSPKVPGGGAAGRNLCRIYPGAFSFLQGLFPPYGLPPPPLAFPIGKARQGTCGGKAPTVSPRRRRAVSPEYNIVKLKKVHIGLRLEFFNLSYIPLHTLPIGTFGDRPTIGIFSMARKNLQSR
jgi:hypothetical protein